MPATYWKDWPDETTPITADYLNPIEISLSNADGDYVPRTWVDANSPVRSDVGTLNFAGNAYQPSLYLSYNTFPGRSGGPFLGAPVFVLHENEFNAPDPLPTILDAAAVNDWEARIKAAFPAFVVVTWEPWPSTATPLNAVALNDLLDRIDAILPA